MANKIDFIEAKGTASIEARCITCDNGMTLYRCNRFPICDECLNDMRKIIAERRKPKVVEIGQTIQGGENG